PLIKDRSGIALTDDTLICEVFNSYFSTIFTREMTDPPNFNTRFASSETEEFSNIVIDEDIVKKYLNLLPTDKAPGLYGLNPKLLHETASVLNRPLCMIFSASLSSGMVPEDWRKANVSPIYKKGSRHDPCNYRPISLTSCVCKVLERIIKYT